VVKWGKELQNNNAETKVFLFIDAMIEYVDQRKSRDIF
jgi:hypothetical protein